MKFIPSARGVSPFSRLLFVFAFLFTLSVLARAQAPAESSKSPATEVPSDPTKSPTEKPEASHTPTDTIVSTDAAKVPDYADALRPRTVCVAASRARAH